MAERKGFEPLIPFWGIHDFQSCALDQLGHLSTDFYIIAEAFLIVKCFFNNFYDIFYIKTQTPTMDRGRFKISRYPPQPFPQNYQEFRDEEDIF